MEEELIDKIDFSVSDSPTPRKRAIDSSSSPPRENFTGLLGGISHPIKKIKQTNMTSHPDSDEFSDEQNSFDDVPQNSQTVFVFEKIKRLSREVGITLFQLSDIFQQMTNTFEGVRTDCIAENGGGHHHCGAH